MPALNFYLAPTTANGWRLLSETPQAAATIAEGWTVGTGTINHSAYAVGVKRLESTFVDTTPPSGTLNTSLKDAFRTQNPYTGRFAAGDWALNFNVCAVTNAQGQNGRIRFRIIIADADGSNATPISVTQHQASNITDVALAPGSVSSYAVFPFGSFFVRNQYLFFQLAWERTGPAVTADADVNWRTGQSLSLGTSIATAVLSYGGQQIDSASTGMVKAVSVALLGIVMLGAQGTAVATGSNAKALTTALATTGTGTVVQSVSRSLTGQAVACSQGPIAASGRSLLQSAQGTLGVNSQPPLVGHASTVGQGTVNPAQGATVGPLVGQELTAQQGNVLAPNGTPLVGTAITSAHGTLAPLVRPTDIVGQAIIPGIGILSILPGPKTVNITGSEITSAQGTVDSRPVLIGQAITSAMGTVVQSQSVLLVGQVSNAQAGMIGVGQDPDDTKIQVFAGNITLVLSTVPLIGSVMTGAQGTVSVTADAVFALTGQASTPAAGFMAPSMEIPLSGSQVVSAIGTLGAPGGSSLTGQAILTEQGQVFTTNDRTNALVGSAMTMQAGVIEPDSVHLLVGVSDPVSAGIMIPSGGAMLVALTGLSMTSAIGHLTQVGGDTVPVPGDNEGCGVIAAPATEPNRVLDDGVVSEGCEVLAGVSAETEA